ncbi:MAG: YitT family protein [Bacteroidales bacterium]|nr:YitT family protein [Bacteroidales bacterium]
MGTVKENLTSRSFWTSWASIVAGCCILAAGFVLFINPYNIVPGGVYGASIVLHYIFPSIKVGTFGYMFDIPLLIISAIFLGSKLGARTLVAALLTPAIMNIMTLAVYPNEEAVRSLDPALLLGGVIDFSDHLILATIIGAVIIGVGSGIIAKNRATSGGTDIVALLMQKYLKIPFSSAILIADGCVVLFGLFVIGFGGSTPQGGDSAPALYLSFYSLIAIYATSRTINVVLNGAQSDRLLFIVSVNRRDELRDFILKDLDRTATIINSYGLYTLDRNTTLMLVVKNKEVDSVKRAIRKIDPNAFITVTDAHATYGEGWKALPEEDEIVPE